MSSSSSRTWFGRTLRLHAALWLCVAAAACQIPPTVDIEDGSAPALVWPATPAQARIRWAGEVRSPVDLGIRPGRLRRFWNWISGHRPTQMVRPHGLAVDAENRLWVTDPGAGLVHVFDPRRSRYQALPRKGEERLVSPIAVAHDGAGTAYISDSAQAVVRRYTAAGRPLPSWDAGGELVRPTGMAFDPGTGLLWVVDTGRHRLLALAPDGRVTKTIGNRGEGLASFNFPTHLTIDAQGRLLVTDTLNFRIQVLSSDGVPIASLGELGSGPGSLSKPKGVALDEDGHIYVVDGLFGNVQIFDDAGRLLLHFGTQGGGPGEFWLPAGLHIADGGRIYVADAYNRRVQMFDYLGK